MLTNEQADESYQQAFAALHSVVIDPAASAGQQAFAREKRDMLTLEFIGQAIASVEERTRRFRTFIGEMNAVIAAFGSGSTIAGIRRLQGVVAAAGELVGAALAPAKKAAKKSAKAAAKPATPKPAKKVATKTTRRAPKKRSTKPAKKAMKKARGKAVRPARRGR